MHHVHLVDWITESVVGQRPIDIEPSGTPRRARNADELDLPSIGLGLALWHLVLGNPPLDSRKISPSCFVGRSGWTGLR